jgi:V8-like Glu-specific endopeptidase
MSIRRNAVLAMVLLGAVAGSSPVWAQGTVMTAESPSREITRGNSTVLTNGAFSVLAADAPQTVRVPDATWLQLQFSDFNLGRSTLRIRDLKTGELQTFTQAQLESWGGNTAMFNTDRLRISVKLAANERERVFYQLDKVIAGEPSFGTQTNCGADNRVASTERRVARIAPVGCTAWIIGDNLFLTAGHCGTQNRAGLMLQFNVPSSLANGQNVAPPVADQYAIDMTTARGANGGIGNDWAVFRVRPNTQTGLLPRAAQTRRFGLTPLTSAFAIANNRTLANVPNARITGFGSDTGATNQTNQTSTGRVTQLSGTSARYQVDTTGGNSGSPVFASTAPGVAFAIHTNGGCSANGSGSNSGTSFRNTTLWNTIMTSGATGLRLNPPLQ